MKRPIWISLVFLAGLLSLAACMPPSPDLPTSSIPEATLDMSQMATVVEKTVGIRQTIAALESQIARGTSDVIPQTAQPTAATSSTPRPPTATSTSTPVPPTLPAPTTAVPTSSTPCDSAIFVSDVTFPDKSVLAAEQSFTKVWRVKNTGTCAWSPSYSLVFVSGAQMSGPNQVSMPASVKPGETVDLSVNLIAPKASGEYTGLWQLRSADGANFGVGSKSEAFWVKIIVGTTTMSGTSFVDAFCTAIWKNNGGGSLACPASKADFKNGSLYRADTPVLAGGYKDDESALVTIPANGSDGAIIGKFPAFKVLSGDHFVTLLGCMNASPKCTVTFKLSYTVDGSTVVTLGSWDRIYDQNWVKVDIDLTSLADKSVQFIFTVTNKEGSSEDDTAFWLKPYIKR